MTRGGLSGSWTRDLSHPKREEKWLCSLYLYNCHQPAGTQKDKCTHRNRLSLSSYYSVHRSLAHYCIHLDLDNTHTHIHRVNKNIKWQFIGLTLLWYFKLPLLRCVSLWFYQNVCITVILEVNWFIHSNLQMPLDLHLQLVILSYQNDLLISIPHNKRL